jgi:poly-gamma-glutamate synthesis protein (capsule biosynthesis protein)
MRGGALVLGLLLALPFPGHADCPPGDAPYPAQFPDPARFQAALTQTQGIAALDPAPAAITVPHHLEVPDLIAGGLRLAAGARPERILLLFPDHFEKAGGPAATTTRGFQTALGPVPADAAAARALIAAGVEDSCLFGADHGIGALLPFVAALYPGVPLLPVALSIRSHPADWDRLAAVLAPLAGPETLILQSTDFSHYLPHHEARLRDQQVLNILAAGDRTALRRLVQPDHVDSLAALDLTLQLTAGRAAPLVVANRNQQELTATPLAETTSYMVIAHLLAGKPQPRADFGGTVLVLGGDLFLGRDLPRLLSDELVAGRVEAALLKATGGAPLIANLEGVVVEEMPVGLPHLTLAMPADVTGDWAGRMNLIAAGTANNHALDLGPEARAAGEAMLARRGVTPFRDGQRLDLPGLSLVALTDLSNSAAPYEALIDALALDHLLVPEADRQVLAYLHWGRETGPITGPRERALAEEARRRGVALVMGAHPHRASGPPEVIGGGDTLVYWSLGNLLFDQAGNESSGMLVELRVFPQGTVFARPLPLPPLFDLALPGHAAEQGQDDGG